MKKNIKNLLNPMLAITALLSPINPVYAACDLDVDGNQQVDALTDGLLVLRHLFGFSGDALTGGAIGNGASRQNSTAIQDWLTGCFAKQDITPANAPQHFLETVQATSLLTTFAAHHQLGVPGVGIADHLAFVLSQLPGLYNGAFNQPTLAARAITSKNQACPNGGSFDLTINDADGNEQVSAGDVIELAFAQCAVSYESQAATINGNLLIAINSVLADGKLSASLSLTALNYVTAQHNLTVNGGMTMTRTGTIGQGDYTAQGETLQITFSTGKTVTLEDYDLRLLIAVVNAQTVNWSYATHIAKLSESGSTGSKAIETLEEFVGTNLNFPASGVLVITGKKSENARFVSKTIITVIENGVQIDTDSNGDGTIDSTQTLTWDELAALLAG